MRPSRIIAVAVGALLTWSCSAGDDGSTGAAPTQTTVERADAQEQQPQWTQLAPVPTARTEVAAAAARGNIYVIGGFSDAGTVATVEIYDIGTDSWNSGPDLPIAVNHAMATTLGGEIYAVGGYLGPGVENPTDRAFVLRDGSWVEIASMPARRGAGGMVRAKGKLWVVGGVEPDGLATQTFVYDPDTDNWRTRRGVPTDRQHLGAAAFKGRIYVAGGRTSGLDSNMATTERYNIATRKWAALADMPTARGGLAATATSDGFIVAAGGEGVDGTFDEVEAFDVSTRKWRSLPNMPTPRHGLGVVAVGTIVYVIAGGPQPGLHFSDANEAIDLADL